MSEPFILIIRPLPQASDNHRHHVFLSNSLYKTVNTTMEPVTGIEPAFPAWEAGVLPLHHAGRVPVSPGCQAAASVFALTPMTSGCPASVFPSGFAVSQGLAPCGPTSGHGYAPAGGGVIVFARHPVFSSQIRSKTPAPIRVDFYIGRSSPCALVALFCLGAGSGIPPAAGMACHA